jgi:hypothetical protein
MHSVRVPFCLLLLITALVSISSAQWPSDPAVNLLVADGTSDQAQPKILPTPDGGCYISWLDGLGNGYDVRVQKLDVTGKEVFPHNGVLVADLTLSSTTDYGLDVDAYGNALLAYQDDRSGSVQISASKVSPAGVLLWGAGVQLTNTAGFAGAPEIAGTSDGGAVVAWTEDAGVGVQKLDADGAILWGPGLLLAPAAGLYMASDMHGAGEDVILSIVHQTGGFYSPKQLRAQKIDPDGNFLWGATPVNVFDTGSLQFGNFPEFVADGSGGAVFSWYDTSTLTFQCFAQHLLANGTEAFPHNGTAVSTNPSQMRVSPSAAFNPITSETFVFWEEEDSLQSQSGIYGQKLDASGNRMWTNNGAVVMPLGVADVMGAKCVVQGTGAFAFWLQSPTYSENYVYAARLTSDGFMDIAPFYVSSVSSTKSLPEAAKSVAGYAVVAWRDARTDDGDIYAQNVNADGSLGLAGAGVPENGAPSSLWLAVPTPNPTSGTVSIEYFSPAAGRAEIAVYDVRGRVVKALVLPSEAGTGSVTWDGCDETGAPVASGVYFVRLTRGHEVRTAEVILVK